MERALPFVGSGASNEPFARVRLGACPVETRGDCPEMMGLWWADWC